MHGHFTLSVAAICSSLCFASAQSNGTTNGTATVPISTISTTLSFPAPRAVSTSYTSTSYVNTQSLSNYMTQTDFSNERLALLWDRVGSISTGPITTTVKPTPEATPYATPGTDLHPLVPAYIPSLSNSTLPKDFVWGVASSAYQIEGAADAEGKGPSIWDLLSHRAPNFVADNTTGDVTASHYYLYKQDFARLKALGIPSFSPSISWSRIFPFGKGPINEAGVAHYDDVIQELVSNGIRIAVTLLHFDTPLALFDEYGAWNDRQIVDDFFNYATFIISRYDQYVSDWFTINEPQYCNWQFSTYPNKNLWPIYNNISGGLESRFLCGHYSILAHAKIYKWYKNEFKGTKRMTFKNSGNYYEPASSSQEDAEATLRQYDYSLGWFNAPIWNGGDYPASLRNSLGDLLPNFTAEEKDMVQNSCDYFAIDGYTSYFVSAGGDFEACTKDRSHSGFPECGNPLPINRNGFPEGPAGDSGSIWLYSAPNGIRSFLNTIKKQLFPTVPSILVSEFGFSEPFESDFSPSTLALWDLRRADYYQSYLDNILAARVYDGINVTGAWAWAIFDNFEWNSGTRTRFGLQYTDYTSLTRSPKASMFQLLNWFNTKGRGFAGSVANSTMKRLF
ncbi:glycoside hydrolase family 1 protein [Myriangium duriaei CBS 260.36]|uniref:Glycoside hydrolase family 1 protein n=1 Tax=Myriangium duriaei CBS 260.36 TaxID=1168546 RepID=A0A9P4J5V9_9PEZI|nr:glycoside hydrolase family 1 protein [Myriangium duriaei CBS 260.36]